MAITSQKESSLPEVYSINDEDKIRVLVGGVVSSNVAWPVIKDSILGQIDTIDTGGGAVDSVTATSPIVSSGGATPNISMPAATNANAGYVLATHIAAIEANTAKVTNAVHTGDVTGGAALTIAPSAVTLAKMANISSNAFLGRYSSGTGSVESLSVLTVKSMLGITDGTYSTYRNILAYGAVANDVSKASTNTAAIQAAINVGPGVVYIPAGTFYIASNAVYTNYCIKISSTGVTLLGDGPRASILSTTSATANIIEIYNSPSFYGARIQDLSITTIINRTMVNVVPTTSGVDTSLGYAIHISNAGNFNVIDNVWLFDANINYYTGGGVYCGEYSATHMSNMLIFITGAVHGIHITGLAGSKSNEHHVRDCWIQGDLTTESYGLYVENSDGDWFTDVVAVYVDVGVYTNSASSSIFRNVGADTCLRFGFYTDGANTYGLVLDHCWAGTIGVSSISPIILGDATSCGYYINRSAGILLDGCRAQNIGGFGVIIFSTTTDVAINGGFFTGCGYEVANHGSCDAITCTANSIGGLRIQNVRCGSTAGSAVSNRYGIFIQGGSDNFIISGNDCRGNITGAIKNSAGTNTTTKLISNNIGTVI